METKIILYRESLKQSIASDIFTFGMMAGSFAINQFFVGSGALDIILVVMFVVWMLSKGSIKKTTFHSPEEVCEWLAKEFPYEIKIQTGETP